MNFSYKPSGVCSRKMDLVLDGNIIKSVTITGGCSGNLQGISALLSGMTAEEAISKLKGIRCGFKSTSCPDQLSKALEKAISKN